MSINPYTDIPGLYEIPMPVAKKPSKPPASALATRNAARPSRGSRVAERTASLLREYGGDMSERESVADFSRAGGGGRGGGGEPDPKSQLTALKNVLGKPHVYGVADRAFQ